MTANLPLVVATVYGVMSACTFIAVALDKRAAQRGRRRTPEATLHTLELLGGWPGSFAAQQVMRHKNAKGAYQEVFWLIVALHVAGWAAFVKWG